MRPPTLHFFTSTASFLIIMLGLYMCIQMLQQVKMYLKFRQLLQDLQICKFQIRQQSILLMSCMNKHNQIARICRQSFLKEHLAKLIHAWMVRKLHSQAMTFNSHARNILIYTNTKVFSVQFKLESVVVNREIGPAIGWVTSHNLIGKLTRFR